MTTKTKSPKVAAQPARPVSATKSKPATPESAASARLRREARAAVAANLAELERPAPGSDAEPLGHNEQGGEPQKAQPQEQQRQQPDQQPAPAPTTTPGSAATPKPGKAAKKGSAKPNATPATKSAKAAKPKAEKAAKPAKAPKPKRLSCIDAAAQIIGKDPIGCKDLIAEMGQRKLWSSPGGKTPDASLYAAIIREIAAKGAAARFKKVDRGLFIATSAKKGA